MYLLFITCNSDLLALIYVIISLIVRTAAVPNRSGVNLTESFSTVYHKRMWGPDGGGSGGGSTMKATKSTRHFLHKFVLEHNVTRFLDAPCGAMEWQKALLHHIQETRPINFVGMDIVPSVIERNKESFSNEKSWKFIWGDISST